ncbi:alpha-1,2-fucosyltransferase [Eisenbergiella tayi]|nr:alpha-1,2-fucosyltransferase [Eisenbergiella tayi]
MKIMGGFASQFTKYMLGYLIAQWKHAELILDLSDYFNGYFRPFSLCYMDLPNCRVITDINKTRINNMVLVRNSNDMRTMLEKFSDNKNYYLDREEDDYSEALAQYQCLRMGPEISFFKKLKFKYTTDFLDTFKEKIKDKQTVAVHVRRGDFLKLGWQDDTDFYFAAIAWLCERYPGLHFYFFSNDLSWVRNTFGLNKRFHYVSSINGNWGDAQELFCMSECKFRILSRFSGYGRLANVLSAAKENGGYALMDAVDINGNIEGQGGAECVGRKYAKEINAEMVVKDEDGGIVFLNKDLIDKYKKKYNIVVDTKKNHGESIITYGQRLTQQELNNIGTDIGNITEENYKLLLINRYLNYVDIGDRARQRECLEKMPIDDDSKRLWMNWYGLKKELNIPVCICSAERLNRWKVNGWFQTASVLAKCGAEVIYVNLNCRNMEGKDSVIFEACDMDGKELSFQVIQLDVSKLEANKTVINDKLSRIGLVIVDSNLCLRYIKKTDIKNKKIVLMGDKKEDRILGSLYNLFYKFQILDEKKFKRYQSGKLIASEQDKIQFIEDINMPLIVYEYIEKNGLKLIEKIMGEE